MAVRRPLILDSAGRTRELPVGDTLADAQALNPLRTFTFPNTNGGLGGTVTAAIATATAGSYRQAIQVPSEVTAWRMKFRNWDYSQSAKTAASLQALIVGTHDRPLSGTSLESGSFAGGVASTVVGSAQTIPGNGTWYTSPDMTLTGDVLIGMGYTFGSTTSVQTGAGKAWHWTNSTSATTAATAGSGATARYIPFDWITEFDITTRKRVTLVIGDSISEPTTGTSSALEPTSLSFGPFPIWAERTGRLIVNMSLAGIALTHYATTPASNYLWLRQALTGYPIDEIIISAGSNDFNSGRTLAQMQADVTTVISYLRGLGITAPIYATTLLARGTTGNAVRLAWHDWLASGPSWLTDIIDFDGATRGLTATSLVAQWTADNIHPSRLGCVVMADQLQTVLP